MRTRNHPDLADRASSETDRAIELRRARPPAQADRQDRCGRCSESRTHLRLLRGDRRADLDQAPRGPPDRDLSIEAQERHERRERVGIATIESASGTPLKGISLRRERVIATIESASGTPLKGISLRRERVYRDD